MHPSGVAKSSTSYGRGKGWNVTSAGWQVTLCDPIWHVSSSSGVATSVSELLYPCYFTLLYFYTAIRVCSACRRLYIGMAVVINATARGEIQSSDRSHRSPSTVPLEHREQCPSLVRPRCHKVLHDQHAYTTRRRSTTEFRTN